MGYKYSEGQLGLWAPTPFTEVLHFGSIDHIDICSVCLQIFHHASFHFTRLSFMNRPVADSLEKHLFQFGYERTRGRFAVGGKSYLTLWMQLLLFWQHELQKNKKNGIHEPSFGKSSNCSKLKIHTLHLRCNISELQIAFLFLHLSGCNTTYCMHKLICAFEGQFRNSFSMHVNTFDCQLTSRQLYPAIFSLEKVKVWLWMLSHTHTHKTPTTNPCHQCG